MFNYIIRKPVFTDDTRVQFRAGTRHALLGRGVKFDQAKTQAPTLFPFEVIDQRPMEITLDGCAFLYCAVKRGEVSAFVVVKLDRASRSVPDLYSLIALFGKHGVAFHSVTDGLSTGTAAGRMFVGILAVLAQFERELIGERVREVVRLKQGRGERVGRVPFGMRVGADGKRLEPEPAEAAVRERARALRASAGRRGRGSRHARPRASPGARRAAPA